MLMLPRILVSLAVLLPCVMPAQPRTQPAATHKQVIAYIFPRDRVLQPQQVDGAKLTRINYAFANIADGKVVEGFPHDADNYAALRQVRQQHPGLQLLVSVGGWSWSKNFSDVALTEAGRQRFVDSAIAFVQKYDLDGVDIDWEYPGLVGDNNPHRPEDRENYTRLLRALRVRLDAEGRQKHRPLYLSVAANGTQDFIDHTELSAVAQLLDSVNLMAYDMAGYASPTGHHAALYANPLGPAHVSADDYVRAYLRAGVPASKIVLGIPFYGKGWTKVPAERNGLFDPGTPAPNLELGYGAITSTMLKPGSGYQRFWDDAAKVPYLYNAAQKTWIDYEDAESIQYKAQYVREQHLGGVMFWEYSHDPSGTLLKAIQEGLAADAK